MGFGTDRPAQVGTHLRNIQSDSRELFIVTINGIWCDAGSGCDSIANSVMLLSECKVLLPKEENYKIYKIYLRHSKLFSSTSYKCEQGALRKPKKKQSLEIFNQSCDLDKARRAKKKSNRPPVKL